MRLSTRGLRRWIVGTAALLLAVVAGFLIYGRYRFRHIERDLPGRLGLDIQQTAKTITFSQSTQGHTLFTLKAAKQVQMKSGHVLLHDVDITLYGPPGSGRRDRIAGSDFDYDQTHGVIVSLGSVEIELQGTSKAATASGEAGDADANTIRVRTQGLTFLQKTGEASTGQRVEFQLPRAAGTAVGADYNSKTGVIVLDRDVHITTSNNGRAGIVDAAHATLLRDSSQALLVQAAVSYQTEQARADQATVDFRRDGTAEKIDAAGHVRMKTDDGATVDSDIAHILLDAKSQPTRADLAGGVRFVSAKDNETMHGSSGSGTLLFVPASAGKPAQTQLRQAEFRDHVQFDQEVVGISGDPRGHAQKQLQAQKVILEFAASPSGRGAEARTAVAEGSPVLTLRQLPSKGPQQTTRVSADRLVAKLGAGNSIQQLDGTNHAEIAQSSSDGAHNSSRGDVLHVTFAQRPAQDSRLVTQSRTARHKNSAHPSARMESAIETATLDGNVTLTETPAARKAASASGNKPGPAIPPETLTGWAQHAEYHASTQLLHLTGNPRIAEGSGMQMAADQIDYHRDSQNAAAVGHIRATYTQPPRREAAPEKPLPSMSGSGPVHIVAERATMDHDSNRELFYGAPGNPARMWQDPDSLLAPVIEIDRDQDQLRAWGENTGSAPVVSANFTTALGRQQHATVVSVHSQTLVYSDKARQGDFHGSVEASQGGEAIHADDAVLYLKPAASGSAPSSNPQKSLESTAQEAKERSPAKQNSQLERLVATGHVVFTQPGRKGTGEKLVYTTDDGRYVLSGTESAPPQLWDRVHGTTTGEALIFSSQDDKVEVSGGKSSAITETRAKK
jgi:lipopolysaccharide export system protein LptA